MNLINEMYSRIAKILGIEKLEEIEDIDDKAFDVTQASSTKYLNYLKVHITYPCQLMNIKHFQWEEKYFFGAGDMAEYTELKKTRPSHTDIFNLVRFYGIDSQIGILIDVKRISDNREFSLPLAELEVIDKESEDYQVIDDYSVWFRNNRTLDLE